MIPVLETERLILRGWREGDFEPFAAIYADEISGALHRRRETRDNAWRRMAAIIGHWTLRGYGLWVAAPKEKRPLHRLGGLLDPGRLPGARDRLLHSACASADKAMRAKRRFGRCVMPMTILGWRTAASLIVVDNEPSIRVAESLGARRERVIEFRGAHGGSIATARSQDFSPRTQFTERKAPMSLKIRLSRGGAKKRPFYRIVVADARAPRDGRFVEKIGTFDPMKAKDDSTRLALDQEKAKAWLAKGAQPTDRVLRLLDGLGLAKRDARNNPEKAKPRKKAQERAAAAEAAAAKAAEAPAA